MCICVCGIVSETLIKRRRRFSIAIEYSVVVVVVADGGDGGDVLKL